MQLRIPKIHLPSQQSTLDNSLLKQHGDDMPSTALSLGQIILAFQNVRGIDRKDNPANEIFDTMKQYHISIFGAAETNCDYTEDLQHRIKAIAQKTFGNEVFSCSSAKHPNDHGYLPGGVLQLTRGEMASRQPTSGKDDMGRYTWQCFHGKNQSKVCIITAYRVSQPKSFVSDNTAHRQQVEKLLAKGILSPDPRQQILTDLEKFIEEKRSNGYEIILMIDSNELLNAKNSKILQFSRNTGLLDVHSYHHEDGPATSRIGSSTVIDQIFATEGIIDYFSASGHLAYQEGCLSDHILLWATLDVKRFFGGHGPKILRPAARAFKFNNTVLREKFIHELKSLFEHQNITR
jgi:hypothetical protein